VKISYWWIVRRKFVRWGIWKSLENLCIYEGWRLDLTLYTVETGKGPKKKESRCDFETDNAAHGES